MTSLEFFKSNTNKNFLLTGKKKGNSFYEIATFQKRVHMHKDVYVIKDVFM